MPDPSSTSSSEPAGRGWRFPAGGLMALALVFAADRCLLGRTALWRAAEQRLEARPKALVRVELGIARDRIGLAEMAAAPSGTRRVLVFGNSRANDGFQFEHVPPELELVRITHAPIAPLELRLFAREAAERRADLLVMMLSEYDTHRPVRVVPRAGFADLRATAAVALASLTSRPGWSPRFALEERVELERLALAAVFDAYRYRDVLERAWLEAALGLRSDEDGRLPLLLVRTEEGADGVEGELADAETVREAFRPTVGEAFADTALASLRAIRPGPHVRAQEGLVEDALALLSRSGCKVLIVEGPLHPESYALYPREPARAEFLDFARRLVREHGAHLLTLEETGPYPATDFTDPLHLRKRRGRELGALVVQRALEILGLEPPAAAGDRAEPR